ncbi:MAG: DUF3108 domain-containing protein [Rhodospirillaceae bacterium]|nr:DUF3108 domain-containing protein [Rhodospirillaceae bacterium]
MIKVSRLHPISVCTAVLAAAVFAAPANARPVAENGAQERLAYELMLGGLHVGDAMVSLDETPTGYKAGLKMAATGALKWVRAMRSSLESEGTFGQLSSGGTPQPVAYRKEWVSGEFAETMTMTFDPKTRTATTASRVYNPLTGATIADEDLPWNRDGRKRKPVPDDMRTNVFDPMAAFVAAREQLIAKGVLTPSVALKNFRVPIYDGSRRYDIVGKAEPVRAVSINGEEKQLLPVTGKLEPVFGFNPKSEERMRNIDGKIYFSPDGKFVPAQIIVSGEVFTSVMNLAADCKTDNTKCAAIEAAFTTPPAGEQRAQAP